jgi:hypothetical protein
MQKTACVDRLGGVRIFAVITLLGGSLVPLTKPPVHTTSQPAVEFAFRPFVTAEERGRLAIELWRSGVVEQVDPPRGESRHYVVRLRDPTNLLFVQEIEDTLRRTDAVLRVYSVLDYLR